LGAVKQRRISLGSARRCHGDVEDVASPNYEASIVGGCLASPILSGSIQDDVHVAIAVDHLAPIFSIVLELDCHVAVHFTDEKVKWLSRWFQVAALSRVSG
jgi:hypothetical protein